MLQCSAEYRYSKFGHPSSIDIESTDFEDNLETDVLSSSHHTAEPDFRPFSSRIDAMAYLIVHSPCPMGELNLEFIFYTLRQLQPSLSSVSLMRRFRLPGFLPPQRYCTTKGIPYYDSSHSKDMPGSSTHCEHTLPFPYFVEFMETGKKVTGRVHDFVCFEEKVGVFVNIEALEQYPNQCGSWIISGVQCVPVNAILCVLPQAGTWAEHIYKPDHIVGTTSLTQLNDGEYMAFTTPHPLKKRSIELGNMPVVMVPLMIYSDDTSGNKSKLRLCKNLDGIVAYDAAMQCDVLIVLCLLCDNPRAAQISSHLGSSTRKFCQICNVDVTVGLRVHEKCTKTETVQQRSAIMAARTKGQKKN
ncbi:hypothetical protein EMCRGX_G034099 [Ephydatia muelleri]